MVYFSQDTHYSGHKLIGSPLPCGVALTKRDYVARVARSVEYVGVLDTTLAGSRNALTPLMLWYAFEYYGLDGFRKIVAEMMAVAEYAIARFNDNGIPAWRNRNSVTVVFPRPPREVLVKWQIVLYGDIAHIITMPHVTMDTESTGDTGIVIITTDDNDRALRVLTSGGFKAVIDDALVIRLRDEPGALAKVAAKFKQSGVDIQSLHILDRYDGYTMVALSADDRATAEALVDRESIV